MGKLNHELNEWVFIYDFFAHESHEWTRMKKDKII